MLAGQSIFFAREFQGVLYPPAIEVQNDINSYNNANDVIIGDLKRIKINPLPFDETKILLFYVWHPSLNCVD